MNKLMRRSLAVALTATLLTPSVAFAADYDAILDGLSNDELKELKAEIEERLEAEEVDNSNEAGSEGNEFGAWTIDYFTDEFGRKYESLDKAYIVHTNVIEGTFSNSAATDEDCIFIVYLEPLFGDNENVCLGIKMIEYGSYLVKPTSQTQYDVSALDKDGNVYEGLGIQSKNSDLVLIDGIDEEELLLAGGPISISMKETGEYATSKYLFTIEDTTGLEEALKYFRSGDTGSADKDVSKNFIGLWNGDKWEQDGFGLNMTLNADGTFKLNENEISINGTWEAKSESEAVLDDNSTLTIKGNKLIYEHDGDKTTFTKADK